MENKISGDQLFMGLVYSLTQSAFIGLGKLPDPMSGKIEQDLNQASQTIDLLAALLDKTKGNLAADEESFLRRTVSDLRLNYVDEVNKAKSAEKEQKDQDKGKKPEKKETKNEKKENKDENKDKIPEKDEKKKDKK